MIIEVDVTQADIDQAHVMSDLLAREAALQYEANHEFQHNPIACSLRRQGFKFHHVSTQSVWVQSQSFIRMPREGQDLMREWMKRMAVKPINFFFDTSAATQPPPKDSRRTL